MKNNQQKRFLPKIKIKKGDKVKVLSGDYKGKIGVVLEVMPAENKALVEGVRIVSRHTKPNAKNTQGGIIKQEAPIHISNLMLVVGNTPTRVGRREENGKIVRYSKKTQEVIK
ncbi:MAG: 50S ribosomal protein L24 [Chitinophagales bacterium]|nr:50S ribosomal protein L24 [Chitinophagales bacterium]